MWSYGRAVARVAALVGIAAACSEVAPTSPIALDSAEPQLFGGPAPDPASFDGHVDRHFARIAEEVPSFGGLFFDADGRLNIHLTEGSQELSPVRVRQLLGVPLARIGIDLDAQPVVLLPARFGFTELHQLRERLHSVMYLSDVVFTDVDERRNRVLVGVANAAAAHAVEHSLQMLGFSRDAIVISETGPVHFTQGPTLRDRVRPVGGGLQIQFTDMAAQPFFCTLGFNVRAPDRPGVQGFVTAAHCTRNLGGVDGTPYWQPTGTTPNTTDPNFIGTEVHEAPFFGAPIGGCPVGRQCRRCDAAGIRYAPGIDNAFGRIYRTSTGVNIDPMVPTYEIVAVKPFPFVGDQMYKVGRTTGTTQGVVTNTCVNLSVAGTNIVYLCQDIVAGAPQIVGGGDSGAPVFQPEPNVNGVRLAGLLWGSMGPNNDQFTFCAMDNLQFENPGIVPWRVFPPRF
jgi:hypothetical protein